jgi:hypothetical protein
MLGYVTSLRSETCTTRYARWHIARVFTKTTCWHCRPLLWYTLLVESYIWYITKTIWHHPLGKSYIWYITKTIYRHPLGRILYKMCYIVYRNIKLWSWPSGLSISVYFFQDQDRNNTKSHCDIADPFLYVIARLFMTHLKEGVGNSVTFLVIFYLGKTLIQNVLYRPSGSDAFAQILWVLYFYLFLPRPRKNNTKNVLTLPIPSYMLLPVYLWPTWKKGSAIV